MIKRTAAFVFRLNERLDKITTAFSVNLLQYKYFNFIFNLTD